MKKHVCCFVLVYTSELNYPYECAEYNTQDVRGKESSWGANHTSVELWELKGLGDLDSLEHKEQMHIMGHYESDEPIRCPLWLLKAIHSSCLGL